MEVAKIILEYIQTLVWPAIVIFVVLYFKKETSGLLDRLKSATLPGGITLDLNEKIQEVRELSTEVQGTITAKQEENKGKPIIPITEANARLMKLGFRPSPSGMDMGYYEAIASQDPNLSLAGLRIDIDILVRNLAKGFNINTNDDKDSTVRILRNLLDDECIYNEQYALAIKVLSLCNQAIHGTAISYYQAIEVINSAKALVEDYIAWMSWGFDDDWDAPGD